MRKVFVYLLLLAGLISSASAASYTFGVYNVTDGSSFWISRQSANMTSTSRDRWRGRSPP
jgi:hypothetical protein